MNKALAILCTAVAALVGGTSLAQQGPGTASEGSGSGPVPAGAADAPGYRASTAPEDQPRSRAEVQAEGTRAMHSGELPRGEALATWERPHGGPLNGDDPSTGAAAGHTNGGLLRNLAN